MSTKSSPGTARGVARAYKQAMRRDPCAYCGAEAYTLDHIDSKSRGGGDGWENLTAVCYLCNCAKASRSLLGFLGARASGVHARLAAVRAEASAWQGVGS